VVMLKERNEKNCKFLQSSHGMPNTCIMLAQSAHVAGHRLV